MFLGENKKGITKSSFKEVRLCLRLADL